MVEEAFPQQNTMGNVRSIMYNNGINTGIIRITEGQYHRMVNKRNSSSGQQWITEASHHHRMNARPEWTECTYSTRTCTSSQRRSASLEYCSPPPPLWNSTRNTTENVMGENTLLRTMGHSRMAHLGPNNAIPTVEHHQSSHMNGLTETMPEWENGQRSDAQPTNRKSQQEMRSHRM